MTPAKPIKSVKAYAFVVWIKGKGYINWSSISLKKSDVWKRHRSETTNYDSIIPIRITPIKKASKP